MHYPIDETVAVRGNNNRQAPIQIQFYFDFDTTKKIYVCNISLLQGDESVLIGRGESASLSGSFSVALQYASDIFPDTKNYLPKDILSLTGL